MKIKGTIGVTLISSKEITSVDLYWYHLTMLYLHVYTLYIAICLSACVFLASHFPSSFAVSLFLL